MYVNVYGVVLRGLGLPLYEAKSDLTPDRGVGVGVGATFGCDVEGRAGRGADAGRAVVLDLVFAARWILLGPARHGWLDHISVSCYDLQELKNG